MNEPQYIIAIKRREIACLGEELVDIVKCMREHFSKCVWYASDIDTNNGIVEGFIGPFPVKVGHSDELIALANGVDQFLSGVFLLMPGDYDKELTAEFLTENEQYKTFVLQ